ncbi:MAG: GHMP kinase [Parcubacteria group bacterium GW2011_GWC1_39_29]|uniref:GHMP kinase n=1 Tax=Candidatus Yanofskybacteria bacterium GW2011_GWD1_39_16 TaxID=1619030 RepID=A0A837I007_9BACT|nr:MAG: GHMP kinase [Candidatus Yanofskybacteria bacterium GW2011_GWD1_39_16]KKR15317.1 MAG: GHMP kinase [Parcubacteria group bacterium GW2011_GWC1_39_29]
MIISRTPFRISFFGGGTDYPAWYKKNGGAVLSTTINKYCYLSCRVLPPFFKYKHRIVYSKQEMINKISEINHPSVRETVNFFNYKDGLEIHHQADLPARSGLGSSSAFTVGLINALGGLGGEIRTKRQLALDAIHIEQNLIKENVGSQDQTAAAFGGFNKIEFGGPNEIAVQPITLSEQKLNEFQNKLMLFFTDFSRDASMIAKNWIKNTPENKENLSAMNAMVDKSIGILTGKKNMDDFGRMLDESWKIKRKLANGITNSEIDEIYKTGIRAGAIGGKLLGAGGGGFMLFYADAEAQPKIKEKLKKFLHVPFRFEYLGSQIIYYSSP